MLIEVEPIEGTLAPARKDLATRIANEALSWLSDVIRGIVIRVPARTNGDKTVTTSVVAVLRDGRRFDTLAVDGNVADALERACHELRREIAAAVGRPLRRRRRDEPATEQRLERRSG